MIELIVAMVILGIVLVSLIAVQISAAITIANARDRQEATAYANQAMEQMRAIPYNVLAKGLESGYLTAAGGDARVTSGSLVLDGTTSVLRVGKGAQDKSHPWLPLFTSTGSNKQVVNDVTGTANSYTVRAYVTDKGGSEPPATVGLVVTVDWKDRAGKARHISLFSTAYRGGGCGSLDTQPFLGACQALLNSSSTSGAISTQITAGSLADDSNPAYVPYPLAGPTSSNPFYSLAVGTAGVAAVATSQQVTIVRAIDQYGGTTIDDNDPATDPITQGWGNGFDSYVLGASDDPSLSELPANPSDLAITQASGNDARTVSDGSSFLQFNAQSDYRRPSTADASTTTSCQSGVPAKQPCSMAKISNFAQFDGGSGYILMYVNGQTIRLSRRIEDLSGNGSNAESAWAARFSSSPSTLATVGCTSLSGAGCVSAGASRTMATLAIGTVIGGSWGGKASEGLVLIEGKSGSCAAGLTESIYVQRGGSQKTTAQVASRCGTVRYWNGSAYTTSATLDATTSASYTTTPVTWTSGSYSVTGVATVTVSPATTTTSGPANCDTDACVISADAGTISIDATYTITGFGTPFVVTSGTLVNPPSATASYKAAPTA